MQFFYLSYQDFVSVFHPGDELNEVGIITADTSNDQSLFEMCRKGKIVLNCVGPVWNFLSFFFTYFLLLRTAYDIISCDAEKNLKSTQNVRVMA